MASTNSASEAVSTPSFNDIDEYTLAHIFQYLSLVERTKVERVCKLWKTTSREHGYLYSKRLTIGFDTGRFPFLSKSVQENESYLKKILCYHCKYIEDVNFTRDCRHAFHTEAIMLLTQWCPKLKRLDAQYLMVSNRSLTNLVKGCQILEELILGGISRISENHLGEFLSGAKRLKRFSVIDQICMSGKCLLKLTPGILESLHIEGCRFFHLTPEIAAFLAPSLTRFSFIGNSWNYTQNLENITQLPNLRRLLIHVGPGQLTKYLLNNIVQNCSLLEAVDLGKSLMGYEDHDFTVLLNLPNLKELTIMSKIPAGKDLLMNKPYEKIERLTLGCSKTMNIELYRNLIDQLPALKYFSACSCSLDRHAPWVLDAPGVLGKNLIVRIYLHKRPKFHIGINFLDIDNFLD